MKFEGLVDKRNIRMLLGVYCNKPELVIKYETTLADYPEKFHKIVFGAIHNIAVKNAMGTITVLDIENEISHSKTAMDIWNVNRGIEYITSAIEDTVDLIGNIENYWDAVRKYSILRNAKDELKMDISFVYEPYDELDITDAKLQDKKDKMELFQQMKSDDLLRIINDKFNNFADSYKSKFTNNYNFNVGDVVENLIEKYKTQDGTFGFGYQNLIFNTTFRGKKPKKYIVKSKGTGAGKSRMMLGEACDLSYGAMYDWTKKQWVMLGEPQASLYITSELTEDEVTPIVLAHLSGIDEGRIIEWMDITDEEKQVIGESVEIMKNGLLYCEYAEEFSTTWIKDVVRKYVVSRNIYGLFFDYISENVGLYAESYKATGTRLRTDQILLSLSNTLKLLGNRYDLYVNSSTQLNDNIKTEGNFDTSSVRGAKAIIDKADIALIGMKLTAKDYKKIDPILKSGFYKRPNYFYSCYKNRGGRYVNFLCFTLTDLGTCREEAIFCTDMDYNLWQIEQTELGFNVEVDVSKITYTVNEDEGSATDFVKEYTTAINSKTSVV